MCKCTEIKENLDQNGDWRHSCKKWDEIVKTIVDNGFRHQGHGFTCVCPSCGKIICARCANVITHANI